MDLPLLIKEYNEKVFPEVLRHNRMLSQLLVSTSTDENKAKVLLIGDTNWYPGCHQWYLRLHKDLYKDMIYTIVKYRIWEMSLDSFSSFKKWQLNLP